MANSDKNVWGIHAGRTGDADKLFFEHNVVALGWAKVGNLAKLKPNHDAFKTHLSKCYPEASPGPHDSLYLFDEFVERVKNRVVSSEF
jgi:restriction system protein